jgi:hypothetical protein
MPTDYTDYTEGAGGKGGKGMPHAEDVEDAETRRARGDVGDVRGDEGEGVAYASDPPNPIHFLRREVRGTLKALSPDTKGSPLAPSSTSSLSPLW